MWASSRVFSLVLTAAAVMLHGCATLQSSLKKDDYDAIKRVKVVRSTTPEFWVRTAASLLASPLSIAIDRNATNDANKHTIPDIGDLLTKSFASQINDEFPNWTDIYIETKPVEMPAKMQEGEQYKYKDGHLLTLYIDSAGLAWDSGFFATVRAHMVNSDGKIIYHAFTFYRTSNYGDYRTREEYLADGGKLLIEEMQIAADRISKDVIKHLKET